jgi:hypothetical protein
VNRNKEEKETGIVLIRNYVHPVVLRGLRVPVSGCSGSEIIVFTGFI